MSEKEEQANNEFLEKLKSLTFGFGVKPDDKCPGCGKPLKDHHLKFVGIGIVMPVPKHQNPKTPPPEPEPEEAEVEPDVPIAFSA